MDSDFQEFVARERSGRAAAGRERVARGLLGDSGCIFDVVLGCREPRRERAKHVGAR